MTDLKKKNRKKFLKDLKKCRIIEFEVMRGPNYIDSNKTSSSEEAEQEYEVSPSPDNTNNNNHVNHKNNVSSNELYEHLENINQQEELRHQERLNALTSHESSIPPLGQYNSNTTQTTTNTPTMLPHKLQTQHKPITSDDHTPSEYDEEEIPNFQNITLTATQNPYHTKMNKPDNQYISQNPDFAPLELDPTRSPSPKSRTRSISPSTHSPKHRQASPSSNEDRVRSRLLINSPSSHSQMKYELATRSKSKHTMTSSSSDDMIEDTGSDKILAKYSSSNRGEYDANSLTSPHRLRNSTSISEYHMQEPARPIHIKTDSKTQASTHKTSSSEAELPVEKSYPRKSINSINTIKTQSSLARHSKISKTSSAVDLKQLKREVLSQKTQITQLNETVERIKSESREKNSLQETSHPNMQMMMNHSLPGTLVTSQSNSDVTSQLMKEAIDNQNKVLLTLAEQMVNQTKQLEEVKSELKEVKTTHNTHNSSLSTNINQNNNVSQQFVKENSPGYESSIMPNNNYYRTLNSSMVQSNAFSTKGLWTRPNDQYHKHTPFMSSRWETNRPVQSYFEDPGARIKEIDSDSDEGVVEIKKSNRSRQNSKSKISEVEMALPNITKSNNRPSVKVKRSSLAERERERQYSDSHRSSIMSNIPSLPKRAPISHDQHLPRHSNATSATSQASFSYKTGGNQISTVLRKDVRVVQVVKSEELELSICGGNARGIFISYVGKISYYKQNQLLKEGDKILAINNIPLYDVTKEDANRVLQESIKYKRSSRNNLIYFSVINDLYLYDEVLKHNISDLYYIKINEATIKSLQMNIGHTSNVYKTFGVELGDVIRITDSMHADVRDQYYYKGVVVQKAVTNNARVKADTKTHEKIPKTSVLLPPLRLI